MNPIPENSFAYIVYTDEQNLYTKIKNSLWVLDAFTPANDEKFVGVRVIDDTLVNVWYSKKLEGYCAQRRG